MQMLRRAKWLLLVLVLVPALLALMGCEELEMDEPVDEPPPIEQPGAP